MCAPLTDKMISVTSALTLRTDALSFFFIFKNKDLEEMRLDVCSFLIRHAAYILFLKNTPIRGAYDITVRREETLLRYL